MSRDEKKAAFILAAIAVVEGMWCLANVRHPSRFLAYMGFLGASAPVVGWVLATLVFVDYFRAVTALRWRRLGTWIR